MKKIALTIAIILGLGLTSFADPNQGGGLFQRGATSEDVYFGSNRDATTSTPMLPNHGLDDNQNADSPLGSGIAVLLGLGAAYAVGKNRKKD